MTLKRSLVVAALLTAAVSVSGCSTLGKLNFLDKKEANKSTATAGQRISVIAFDQKVEVAEALKGSDFFLPEAAPQADWRLPGGNAEQSVEHVAAAAKFEIAWRKGFGQKATRPSTSPPRRSPPRARSS